MKSDTWIPSHFLTECDVCGCLYRADSGGEAGSLGEFGCRATIKFGGHSYALLDLCDNCAAEYISPLVNVLQERAEEKKLAEQAREAGESGPSPADDPGAHF